MGGRIVTVDVGARRRRFLTDAVCVSAASLPVLAALSISESAISATPSSRTSDDGSGAEVLVPVKRLTMSVSSVR
jgi:hypothetical protein